ncbi:unnamed protein product [Bubo scandiacus]
MLRFGQHLIKPSVVFLKTELSFALVNRKPVVPGRILSSSTSAMGARTLGKSWEARASYFTSFLKNCFYAVIDSVFSLVVVSSEICCPLLSLAVSTRQTDSLGCRSESILCDFLAPSKGFVQLLGEMEICAVESSNFSFAAIVEVFGKS